MSVGIACPFVMDGKICAHPSRHKIVLDIGTDKGQLLRWQQLHGKGNLNLAGKPANMCQGPESRFFKKNLPKGKRVQENKPVGMEFFETG